ncbi:MAG TPA: c-type cytochrome [Chitinophagaceae bacterium]|nr:c-type cytochrome [Chitinophagaceae bacterium]
MIINRKYIVTGALAAIVIAGVAFTAPNPPDEGYKNLKVLPKNTTHDELGKIMHEFNRDLGVKCNFCHAPSKDGSSHPDFVSDEKPEKGIARSMMRMTLKINKKFFETKHPLIGDSTLTITCYSCHHGEAHPEQPAPMQPMKRPEQPQPPKQPPVQN